MIAIEPMMTQAARFARVALLALLCQTGWAGAASAQDLDLKLEYRTVTVGFDGVTRTTEYVERFTRRADRVWTEKVMPAVVAGIQTGQAAAPGASHQHLDLGRAARSVERLPDGRVIFTMVNVADRLIVDIGQPDYSTVGFDGSWGQNYFLIAPSALRQMQRVGAGPSSDTVRYERSTSAGTTRVVWDERLKIPLEVVSVSKDGRTRQSMISRVVPSSALLPWAGLERFDRRSLADFSD